MPSGSLTKPRKSKANAETVAERALRQEVERVKVSPNPWGAANSRIATALQEMRVVRGNARAKYYEHDDDRVREDYEVVADLARRVVAFAEMIATIKLNGRD